MSRSSAYCLPLLGLLLLAGCATPPPPTQEAPATPATSSRSSKAAPASATPVVVSRPQPDATYTLTAGERALPAQVNSSLQEFAARIKANRSLVIRLESYVPSGGSREMNISLSNSAVERIRQRLVELGVPSYRITLAPLGEEHPEARKLDSSRVELFVVPLPR